VRHYADARFVWNLALEQWSMWRRDKAARGVFTPNNAARMRHLGTQDPGGNRNAPAEQKVRGDGCQNHDRLARVPRTFAA